MSDHRGRLQVQGDDLPHAEHASWSDPWSSPKAHPHAAGTAGLARLRQQCPQRSLELRTKAFVLAQRFMDMALPHGVEAPVSQTFQNRNLPPRHADARVDIEVKAGLAFVA